MNPIRLLCCLLIPFSLIISEKGALGLEPKYEVLFPRSQQKIRIQSLWPSDYAARVAIEPAIPSDFIMKRLPPDTFPGYFAWGPKKVLETCDFKNLNNSTDSFLCFHASMDVAQTGPQSFSGVERLEEEFKKMGAQDITRKLFMWGDYPVLQIGGTYQGKYLFSAWIGSNYCSNTIFARLQYPSQEGRPNKSDILLWERFLSQTKSLPEPECYIAQGFDMQTGYTWMDPHGEKLLCVAERRKNDNKIQIVVLSQDKETSFSVKNVVVGPANTAWRGLQEIAKIQIAISKKFVEGGSIEMPSTAINVFVKSVEKFSLDKEALQVNPRVFVQ